MPHGHSYDPTLQLTVSRAQAMLVPDLPTAAHAALSLSTIMQKPKVSACICVLLQ